MTKILVIPLLGAAIYFAFTTMNGTAQDPASAKQGANTKEGTHPNALGCDDTPSALRCDRAV